VVCSIPKTTTAEDNERASELVVTGAPIPTSVLIQSPAETDAALQVICLFQSDPANILRGSLIETNKRLNGLREQIRKPICFEETSGSWFFEKYPPKGEK
jgi:hypothetical protein